MGIFDDLINIEEVEAVKKDADDKHEEQQHQEQHQEERSIKNSLYGEAFRKAFGEPRYKEYPRGKTPSALHGNNVSDAY